MMTSCGRQPLNVLTVLSLLISAGRTSVGAQREGEVWGAGSPFPGSVVAHPGFWVLTGGSPSSLPHWHPPGEELWFGAVRPTVCCALHTGPQSSAERVGHGGVYGGCQRALGKALTEFSLLPLQVKVRRCPGHPIASMRKQRLGEGTG